MLKYFYLNLCFSFYKIRTFSLALYETSIKSRYDDNKKTRWNKNMQSKEIKISTMLIAVLLVSVVFVSVVSAQPESSADRVSKYQNISWGTVKLLESGISNGQVYELFFLKSNNQVKYVAVLAKSGEKIVREITPNLISSKSEKKVLSQFNVSDEKEVAEISRICSESTYNLPISSSGTASIVVKYNSCSIVAKNVLGIELWNLTAAGYFHVDPGVQVTYVADDSSAWANLLLGWYVSSFNSYASWNANIGTVDAQAQFKNLDPIPPTYNAWAKSQVDKNLVGYCSGGSSSS